MHTAQTNLPHVLQFIFHSDMREKESIPNAHFLRQFFVTSTRSLHYSCSLKPLHCTIIAHLIDKRALDHAVIFTAPVWLLQSQLRHVDHIHMPERSSPSSQETKRTLEVVTTLYLVTCWPKTHSLRPLASTNLSFTLER